MTRLHFGVCYGGLIAHDFLKWARLHGPTPGTTTEKIQRVDFLN